MAPAPKTAWHYDTIGAQTPEGGAPFIWLHGWGQTGSSLSRLAQLFIKNGSHLLYDLPGFGKTAMLEEGADTRDYADTLAALLREKGTKKHIIVGHSFGGRMAIQLAAHHPDLVKAIIIIAGAGLPRKRSLFFKTKAFVLRQVGKLARLSDKLFGTTFREAYVNRFGSEDYKNAGPLRATFVNTVTENLSCEARNIKAPVLLLYGADDNDTPPEIGRRYEQLIPIARFEEVSGFGHLDILSRGAYQCEALIRSFLKDLNNA